MEQHLNPHFTDSATAFLSETPFHPPPDMPLSNIRVSSIQEHHFGPPVHVDRHEAIHQANRIDIPTTFTFTSIPLCWTAFQASCTVRLTTVRDVIIPPCLPLFQSKCPSCVNQHEIVSSHVTTNSQASTTPEIRILDNLRLASADPLGQSRLTSVLWHTGFCHKNDHDRFTPGPLHQTIRSGAVPDFTTSDNQETDVQETAPYRGTSLHLEENSAQMCQQRSILADTARSSLKQNLQLPQHITTCSGAVPSINHYAVFRLSREDVVFSDGVCDRINCAATAFQDLIRISMPLRSALFEPYDSLPAQHAFESYLQQGVQQKADECVLSSHFVSKEDHRPQHFTTWSGAVPIYNNSISDGTRLLIQDCDYQHLGPRQSQNTNLARVILQYQDAAQLPRPQWSSIGTHETASKAERSSFDFPDYLSDSQICTLILDGGHQAQDHIPLRVFCVSPYVPRHQNNDVVLSAPLQGLFVPNLFTMPDLPILQPLENTSAFFHQRDLQIDATDSQPVGERVLLFDLKSIAPRPLHNTTISGAVPDPTSVIQGCFRALRPGLLQFTIFSGAVPVNVNESHERLQARHLQGWSHAIYRGGHPAWGKCQIVHMASNPPFDERCAAAMQDEGWLASDEALWFLRKLQEWRSDVVIGPMVQWSPSRDLHHIMDAENQLQYTNNRLNLQIFLVDAHWCAVEIDRRTDPAHVVLIQWPPTLQTTAVLEISRIMQISPSRLLITVNDDNEVMTMCGWTILWRWYKNFAMETCLQPMIYATPQHQEQLNRVILRSQQSWNRTNATRELCRFAMESRQAFMAEYARGQADTRLPPGVDTTMFVGPPKEYVQEVCLKQRSPTHREREINWLRTMLIQPAWLTNFEVETVLQAIRLQMIDRYLPPPLHFNSTAEILEPFVNDLPSLAGYSKVLFFVTFHHHWITISGLKHENRWMLTAAVPDPKSSQLPVLFSAIAAILESSPSMVHIQAVETRSPPHLCGWMLLQSLRDYVSLQMFPDTTLLLQRIATMPNSRIKTLLFEEALSTWTRHAPNQDLVTFAAQVRIFVLAHMDTWTHDHILHFGGMFPSPTPPKAQASWNVVSQATKSKILQKIRSHVQRPFVCPCVQRLTAYVEIDRRIASDDNIAIFAATIKPSPLQWASHFCQESVIHAPCSHVQTTEVMIQVPKLSASLIPGRVEAIIYQGRVTGTAAQFVISLLDLESGIRIFRHGRNHATLNLDIGEFCSGAFSGWTQAGKVLETMGFPTATKFAIDHDHCVATWYARNFTDGALAAKPEDIFRLRDEAFYYREAPIMFQTDVQFGWYLLFCEPIEIATASPPCPAFSAAGTATGLEKAEGQVIIDTILKIMLLQPKVLVLEEVATLHTHAHFPLILELLNWGNFQVAWQTTLNLDDWLPQSRPRLILVAFRRCSSGLQHFPCQPWRPGPSRSLSLQDSHCLLTDEAITEITAAPLDFETAKLYFDPSKVPGAVPRSFKDVIRFRLRTPDDRVQCLMASYAYGHEFDAASQSSKGIFGSLLRHQGRVRFLAGPELLWLQGLSVEWRGPLNARLLNHIVGNAISVPHALIGLFNVLGHFAHLGFDSFSHELFAQAMASRLHSKNSDCVIDVSSGTFTITPKLVPATAQWEIGSLEIFPLTRAVFLQGNKRRTAFVQSGLPVLPILRCLFSAHEFEQILWLPFDRSGLAFPPVDTDKFCGTQMTFSIPESYRLCLHEQLFHAFADQWTVVLFPDQLIVYQVKESATVASIGQIIAQELSRSCHLCNHMLQRLEATSKPRQVMVARRVDPPETYLDETIDGIFLDQGDCLQATLTTSEADLFLQTCHASGVSDLLWSLGWQMFQLQDPHPRSSCRQLNILPTSTQLFVDAVAVRNMLAAHITKWYIPPSVTPTTNTALLSLKLWATVIWEGHVQLTARTDIFANAWEAASSLMGPLIPVRSILRGKRLSPEENFAGYIAPEDRESQLNRVHLVGVLSGGGIKQIWLCALTR